MKKYYSEEVVKDTRYRAEYVQTIDAFLEAEKQKAEEKRKAFISPQSYVQNPELYRQQYKQMLGFPLTCAREMPQCIEKTFVGRDGNVDIYRMQFLMPFGIKFYGMYFQQVDRTQSHPFIFGLHGGWGTPELIASIHHNSSNYNHLIRRMTDRGADVFAPQLLLWNMDTYGNTYNRAYADGKLRQLGGSMTAMEVYFLQCVLDYFESCEPVDMQRLGVAGCSYGGMYTVALTAAEPRVKACYSCSWVNDCFVNSWADWSYSNAQFTFTTAEMMALIAPRPLVAAMGDKDALFGSALTEKEVQKVLPYYQAFGAAEHIKCVVFDGTHEVDKGEEELDFLFTHLSKKKTV